MLITRKLWQGIRQQLLKTSESEEDCAVHEDVMKGPCTSTLVLINITPSTIQTIPKEQGGLVETCQPLTRT